MHDGGGLRLKIGRLNIRDTPFSLHYPYVLLQNAQKIHVLGIQANPE